MQKCHTKAIRRKWELSLLCGFCIAVLLSVTNFAAACGNIRTRVLRMHVIANSDTEFDQTVKLQVRDAVLAAGKDLFDGSLTAETAEQVLRADIQRLTDAADAVLAENGCNYRAKVEIGKSFFDTRTYDDAVTLPAGEYEAVRVILGEGRGKNWWCVMFPPLCLPAAEAETQMDAVLSEQEAALTRRSPKYEVRFKLIEWFEELAAQTK